MTGKEKVFLACLSGEYNKNIFCSFEEEGLVFSFINNYDQVLEQLQTEPPTMILIGEDTQGEKDIRLMEKIKQMELDISVILIGKDLKKCALTYTLAIGDFIENSCLDIELISRMKDTIARKREITNLYKSNQQLKLDLVKLKRYFPKEIADFVIKKGEEGHTAIENIDITIMFLDIRNFTSLSENLRPKQVSEILNILYTDIMDIVMSHNGAVSKIIGDALLITFGCPTPSPDDAMNSIKSAMALLEVIQIFNTTRPSFLKNKIKIGMGISSGSVFAGNIGSFRRMEYTVVGDVVNLAARLQELTKRVEKGTEVSGSILIDESTYQKTKDNIMVKHIVLNRVRGKEKLVKMHLLTDFHSDFAEKIAENRKSINNWRI